MTLWGKKNTEALQAEELAKKQAELNNMQKCLCCGSMFIKQSVGANAISNQNGYCKIDCTLTGLMKRVAFIDGTVEQLKANVATVEENTFSLYDMINIVITKQKKIVGAIIKLMGGKKVGTAKKQ